MLVDGSSAPMMRDPPIAVEQLAACTGYHKGETIYYQDCPAAYCYRIVTGAACECTLLADGRRQVIGFLMPGDMFGLWTRDTHPYSCEVIAEPTTVARYSRHRIERLAESDPEVARHVHQLALEAIECLQDRTALLAKTSALERVSGLLLQMSARSATGSGGCIALPMSRYDIADYLALAVETVSRTLTSLRLRSIIQFVGVRRVRIVDRAVLQWCSEHHES
jgi:CRP/FNR family transcriptional regulator, nitrogen fixation regulation protein